MSMDRLDDLRGGSNVCCSPGQWLISISLTFN